MELTSGNPRDPEGGSNTPSDVDMTLVLSSDIESSDENENRRKTVKKKVKTTVVILTVIWETEARGARGVSSW